MKSAAETENKEFLEKLSEASGDLNAIRTIASRWKTMNAETRSLVVKHLIFPGDEKNGSMSRNTPSMTNRVSALLFGAFSANGERRPPDFDSCAFLAAVDDERGHLSYSVLSEFSVGTGEMSAEAKKLFESVVFERGDPYMIADVATFGMYFASKDVFEERVRKTLEHVVSGAGNGRFGGEHFSAVAEAVFHLVDCAEKRCGEGVAKNMMENMLNMAENVAIPASAATAIFLRKSPHFSPARKDPEDWRERLPEKAGEICASAFLNGFDEEGIDTFISSLDETAAEKLAKNIFQLLMRNFENIEPEKLRRAVALDAPLGILLSSHEDVPAVRDVFSKAAFLLACADEISEEPDAPPV